MFFTIHYYESSSVPAPKGTLDVFSEALALWRLFPTTKSLFFLRLFVISHYGEKKTMRPLSFTTKTKARVLGALTQGQQETRFRALCLCILDATETPEDVRASAAEWFGAEGRLLRIEREGAIRKRHRYLVRLVHPDLHSEQRELATQAAQRLNLAAERAIALFCGSESIESLRDFPLDDALLERVWGKISSSLRDAVVSEVEKMDLDSHVSNLKGSFLNALKDLGK